MLFIGLQIILYKFMTVLLILRVLLHPSSRIYSLAAFLIILQNEKEIKQTLYEITVKLVEMSICSISNWATLFTSANEIIFLSIKHPISDRTGRY